MFFSWGSIPLYARVKVESLPGVVDASSPKALQWAESSEKSRKIDALLQDLDHIPEEQLSGQSGAGAGLYERLRAEDGPEYLTLRDRLARAEIRKSLHPAAKGFLAEILASRWDCFQLEGNLWLASLTSANPDYRVEARRRLIDFIQPAHIPVLIGLLKTPGAKAPAYEILREVTGQTLAADSQRWSAWWSQKGRSIDLAGHLLNGTRNQLRAMPIKSFDPTSFWYLPEGVARADLRYEKRSKTEKEAIARWTRGVDSNVRQAVEDWEAAKPLFERIVHQPDPRVSAYLRTLLSDPAYGDYAGVRLAWRGDTASLGALRNAFAQQPTVGRALVRGSLGDKTALQDLLKSVEERTNPLSFGLMNDAARSYSDRLHAVGALPAEQAFELLAHQNFGLAAAATPKAKKKALEKAQQWLAQNLDGLVLDRKRGYYVVP